MVNWSALEILEQVAGELGLVVPTAIPGDSVQDSQLLAMLNAAGAELVYAFPWNHLTRTWSFTTVPNQGSYDIPSDFAYMLNQTARNTSVKSMLRGPDGVQSWARLPNDVFGGSARYRILGREFLLRPVPKKAETIELDYITSDWARSGGGTSKSRVTVSGDNVLHDAWLMVKFVKYKYLDLKGLGTEGSINEFNAMLMLHIGRDRGGKVLSLVPRYGPAYIGSQSIPEGNWIP